MWLKDVKWLQVFTNRYGTFFCDNELLAKHLSLFEVLSGKSARPWSLRRSPSGLPSSRRRSFRLGEMWTTRQTGRGSILRSAKRITRPGRPAKALKERLKLRAFEPLFRLRAIGFASIHVARLARRPSRRSPSPQALSKRWRRLRVRASS